MVLEHVICYLRSLCLNVVNASLTTLKHVSQRICESYVVHFDINGLLNFTEMVPVIGMESMVSCSAFVTHEITSLIARFVGPTWGPPGADRTQVVPMLAPWTLLSGLMLGMCSLIKPVATEKIREDVIKWKHFPCYWPFVRRIHWSLVGSPHRGQWHRALMYSMICAWTNGWANKQDTTDLRCQYAHYEVTVMDVISSQNPHSHVIIITLSHFVCI